LSISLFQTGQRHHFQWPIINATVNGALVGLVCIYIDIVHFYTLFGPMINLPKKRIVSILDQLLVYSLFVSDDLNLCLPPYQNLVWWIFFIIHNLLWNTLKLNTPTSGVLNQIKSLVWLDHRWDFSNYISPKHIKDKAIWTKQKRQVNSDALEG
jgi:hypothetical protein